MIDTSKTLPWDVLRIEAMAGRQVPAELGVFRSDPTGTQAMLCNYWHSGAVGMVADLPTEAAPTYDWGVLVLK